VTASPASARIRLSGQLLLAALVALLCLGVGCHGPAGAPIGSAFNPSLRTAPPPPDVVNRTTAEIARSALVSDARGMELALRRLENIERVLEAEGQAPTGLTPVALDLRNASLDDKRTYRRASEELLDRDDLDPALRKRIEIFKDDAPLELASDRIRDAQLIEFARAFNAVAEPVGSSLMTMKLAPYRLGRSLVNYAVQMYTKEVFALQRRQALAHWKEFAQRNPEAPELEQLEPRILDAQNKWAQHQRARSLRVARKALASNRIRLALVYADRALRYVPEDREASELREEAALRLLAIRENQRRSLGAAESVQSDVAPLQQRELAVALLAPGGDVAMAAKRLYESDPAGPLADEALYAKALALGEAGQEAAMWELLGELADRDFEHSNMARHAATLISNPQINTWRAFSEARRRGRTDRASWIFLGPFFKGPNDLGLPGPMDWVVAAPSIAEAMLGTPMRLINVPWAKSLPSARVTATTARRHLARNPEDPRSEDVRDWLQGYERKRGNWISVLELEEGKPDPDLQVLAEMRERAAQQYLQAATYEPNVGLRLGMYRRVSAIYPGTRAARVAGRLASTESGEVTAQRIRLSRGFLEENPEITGPRGLGLRPELMDDDPINAELHPHGVTLLGARVVEVAYLEESGNEKDPPRRVKEELPGEQLARVVSLVEEIAYRNMLVDPLNDVAANAARDLYFERSRLGLASDVDHRPGAISQYTYTGVRERYGMVRTRESILPFDIVVRGDIHTLSLGAFPRIRPPKKTPDAMLYE